MTELALDPNFDPSCYPLQDLPDYGSVADQAFGCGWPELDEILKFYPGQFLVVSGFPGHGKSTFLFNVLVNLARMHKLRSFLYVPENERYIKNALRQIWDGQGFPGWDYFSAKQCYVQSAVPHYLAEPAHSFLWVLEKAERSVQRDGVEIVLIDPWNEIEHAKPKDLLMTDYVRECLMLIKQFCRTLNAIVVMVTHPTKAPAAVGRSATLADCEGSMSWWNKSDNGLLVERDFATKTTKVISAKVRERGAGKANACCSFFVDPNTGIFTPQYGSDHDVIS